MHFYWNLFLILKQITLFKRETRCILTCIFLIFSIFTSVNFFISDNHSFGISKSISSLTINKNISLSSDFTKKINQGEPPSIDNFNITKGYKIEPVFWNLDLPTSITFDDKGDAYIAESGGTIGGLTTHPYILKWDHKSGKLTILVDRLLNPPIQYITFYKDMLYVSNAGKISVVDPKSGSVKDIISGLPSGGDHKTNQIAFGPDGRLYVSQGSATNSGVVGIDNYLPDLGWLADSPQVHDVPAKTITLTGENFTTPNVIAPGPKNISSTDIDSENYKIHIANTTSVKLNHTAATDNEATAATVSNNSELHTVATGAFSSFANATTKGQKIDGNIRCNACILSMNPNGTDIKVVAWGIRDPEGLTFDKNGSLIVANQGSDERGSRPIKNDHDRIYKVDVEDSSNSSKFFGWPDYAFSGNGDISIPVTNSIFKSDRSNNSLSLLMNSSYPVERKVFADAGWDSIITQAALSNSTNIMDSLVNKSNYSNFGFDGKVFVAERGSYAPVTKSSQSKGQMESVMGDKNNNTIIGQVIPNTNKTVGQKIMILDTVTGNLSSFLSLYKPDPTFRPVGVAFSHDGNELYVISIGKQELRSTLPNGAALPIPQTWVYQHTGTIWKISKNQSAVSSNQTSSSEGDAITTSTPVPQLHPKQHKVTLSADFNSTIHDGNPPITNPNVFDIRNGYEMEPLLWNLELPTAVAFDNDQNMFIAESGLNYGGLFTQPRILKLDHNNDTLSVFVDRGLSRPLLHLDFHDGKLYATNGGKISTIDKDGIITNIVSGLPSLGDHWTDGVAFGADKRMYFGVGVATNTGIVGRDNPWSKLYPTFHDMPCKDITLAGDNHVTKNYADSPEANSSAITGAFVPFNTSTHKGDMIEGGIKPYEGVWPGYGCSGSILSTKMDGSDIQLVGWGLRHPYGFAFDKTGKNLVVTMNGMDERGTRPIADDGDKIYVIDVTNQTNWGKWYGWPDYGGYAEPVTNPKFHTDFNIPKNNETIQFLMQKHPSDIVRPSIVLKVGAGVTEAKMAPISDNNHSFGFDGQILIGEYGTLAPQTHQKAASPVGMYPGEVMGRLIGQDVMVFDPHNLTFSDLVSLNTADASFRPTGLQFSPDGNSLIIASVGKDEARLKTPTGVTLPFNLPWSIPHSGSIWKITKNATDIEGTDQGNMINGFSEKGMGASHPDIPYGATTLDQIFEDRYNNNKTGDSTNKTNIDSSSLPLEVDASIVKGAALKRDDAFNPNPILIKEGGTVTWTNTDSVTHTVTNGNGFDDPQMAKEFDSGLLGKTFKHLFKKEGEYPYFCQIHPSMQGMVVVK